MHSWLVERLGELQKQKYFKLCICFFPLSFRNLVHSHSFVRAHTLSLPNIVVLQNVKSALKLQHLMEIYMINDDLFLEPEVSYGIELLFGKIVEGEVPVIGADFEGLFGDRFWTFFQSFVEHFLGCSFGDKTFARFLHLFLRMEFDPKYRIHLFNQCMDSFHLISVAPIKVQ
jgi:hypothetical protein